MAIYHLNLSIGQKSKGQSARAKYQYITAQGRYKDKQAELKATWSGNLPSWTKKNPADYWYQADRLSSAESRLYRQLQIAIPKELSPKLQTALVTEFIRARLSGLPYTVAIHDKGDGNPHAHIIYDTRRRDGIQRTPEAYYKRANKKAPALGGPEKDRSLDKKEWLVETRKVWEKLVNGLLRKAGIEQTVSCETLEAQGIDRRPRHKSRAAVALLSKGITLTADRYEVARLAEAAARAAKEADAAEEAVRKAEAQLAEEQRQRDEATQKAADARRAKRAAKRARQKLRKKEAAQKAAEEAARLAAGTESPREAAKPGKNGVPETPAGTESPREAAKPGKNGVPETPAGTESPREAASPAPSPVETTKEHEEPTAETQPKPALTSEPVKETVPPTPPTLKDKFEAERAAWKMDDNELKAAGEAIRRQVTGLDRSQLEAWTTTHPKETAIIRELMRRAKVAKEQRQRDEAAQKAKEETDRLAEAPETASEPVVEPDTPAAEAPEGPKLEPQGVDVPPAPPDGAPSAREAASAPWAGKTIDGHPGMALKDADVLFADDKELIVRKGEDVYRYPAIAGVKAGDHVHVSWPEGVEAPFVRQAKRKLAR